MEVNVKDKIYQIAPKYRLPLQITEGCKHRIGNINQKFTYGNTYIINISDVNEEEKKLGGG